ncbi:hypothetical protein HDF16_001552 [Granulicella aggregans]|uniref:Fibronectin type-III domain-containing protein n=1 Tax=Granulicella aggregans TaxID=474949 RepID=A0A7W8E2T2_9BACT|nr:fibronectin type III domain-containing protein [Granulicella aggregans]MBB5056867.1 hypothetical protein [Granulicella aggregans]
MPIQRLLAAPKLRSSKKEIVISAEAADGTIVRRAVQRPPHLAFAVVFALIALAAPAQQKVDVTTNHNDLARTGANTHETALTPANVTASTFGLLTKFPVDDQVYSQPLVVTDIKLKDSSFGTGTHDLVFITTVNNSVYAFDANDPKATKPIWHVNFGAPANLYDADLGCLDLNGSMGIIGTPVIDKPHNALYVVALTRVGDKFTQRLHALDLASGADLANSPVTITAPAFDPLLQNQRPALLLTNHTVYVGYASHCDKEPYHGFLLGYDARTLRQTAVLNTSPKGGQASIWQSGQAPAVDAAGNIYIVTGNGTWNGVTDFSESFMKLSPSLKLLDWFTPTNHRELDAKDNDLDSSGATLIPGTNLVVGGGKEGVLYTLDTRKLGHLGDQHAIQHFQATGSHLHSVVFWQSAKNGDLLYIWGQRDKERVYKITNGKVGETPIITRPESNEGHPGAMLSLSANGGHDGILWAAIHASGDSWHETRPGILHAYDADDINHELWNSWQNRGRDDCDGYSKMAPPTVANGKVFLASFGKENIGTGGLCIYGLLPDSQSPAAPTNISPEIKGGSVTLTWPAVSDAVTYTVAASDKADGSFHTIATGLTTAIYSGIQAPIGMSYYTVTSSNSHGEGPPSKPIPVRIENPTAKGRMH